MLICHHCGHHNQPDAVVCEGCANILALTCATCFETVPLSSKFCNHCGAPISLPEALTPRETTNRKTLIVPIAALMPQQLEEKIDAVTATLRDERRMVTILNLQLGGGLQAEAAHEQEEVYLLLDQLLQSLVEIIYEYEGHLDFLANDGLQALFGAPVAHENDAERALRAALDIWARVQQYEPDWQKLGKPLQARLGVHTGNVTIGKVSERWMMDYTIVGNAVKIAQNLGSTASWGEIWVSDVTYRQTRSLFYFRPVDAASAEGVFSGAYVLQGLQRRLGSGQGLFGIPAPLIGRQEMLDAIVTLFAQVRRREKPGAVLLSGEAGVGKSRLVEEARSAILRREGGKTAVYQGYSLSYARSRPYWAIIDLLRNIIGVSEREPLATQFTNLRRHLQQINLWQEDVWPYLAHLLGIRYQDDGQEVPVRVTDASMLQRLTYVALRRLILVEVANSPTVLIFEDLLQRNTNKLNFLFSSKSSISSRDEKRTCYPHK